MKRTASVPELRSAAALQREAGDAAFMNGHVQAANACWIRAAKHDKAADKLLKRDGGDDRG